jgi:PAS domain S-box-containing protein
MSRSRYSRKPRHALDPVERAPIWFPLASYSLLALAAVLVVLALGERLYASRLDFAGIVAVFLVQAATNLLCARTWVMGRRNEDALESEFDSIYRNVLDAILILDDRGQILDANPAAVALLRAPHAALIGNSFLPFAADSRRFDSVWRAFLDGSFARGRMEILSSDGAKLVVNYTLAANHRIGRHAIVLCDITARVEAQQSARESRISYQQMANSIDEIYWLLEARTKKVLAVNRAYETVTGRSLESILREPTSYEDLIHAEDRAHVLTKLETAVQTGRFDEEFRIVRPDGAIRWLWVKAAPVPTADGVIRQLYGTAQDITPRKHAEVQVAQHLAVAEAARTEAEAMHQATLALSQDLRMDCVLDTLLKTLSTIVPYDMASVLLTEEGNRLFVAREAPLPEGRNVLTVAIHDCVFLQRVIFQKETVCVADTQKEKDWHKLTAFGGVRSWIAVPLIVSEEVQGLLSIGSTVPGAFTEQHVRRSKSLAISAAVAIHNARVYEWAQVYAEERKVLLQKLDEKPKRPADNLNSLVN